MVSNSRPVASSPLSICTELSLFGLIEIVKSSCNPSIPESIALSLNSAGGAIGTSSSLKKSNETICSANICDAAVSSILSCDTDPVISMSGGGAGAGFFFFFIR